MEQTSLRDVLRNGGVATGGSNTTLDDTSVNWIVNYFAGAPLQILHGGIEYNTTIISNTATRLTFPALPGGVSVAAGDSFFFPLELNSILHEQADVPISDLAPIAPLVFIILNMAAPNTCYVVRSLRVKVVANPNPNTVTVRLWELVDDVLTEVKSFPITGVNFGTYLSLMDMFGLPQLAGDRLKVTIEASAVGYAFLAQYSFATAAV